ncbi:MAG: hypothetical protein L0Z70_05070, partial [Chloroflexi bacterium]|nr:hypothetical protein [Chloroflexota bacterium]
FDAGWTTIHDGAGVREWTVLNNPAYARTGDYLNSLWWDLTAWDEWFFTPMFTVNDTGPLTATFWATSVSNPEPCDVWPDPYTVSLYVLDEDGNILDDPWDMDRDTNWTWDCANLPPYNEVAVDLAAYAGQKIQLAWHATGNAYFIFFMDDVTVPGVADPLYYPSGVASVTVQVDDTVHPGDWITNTAFLEAVHFVTPEEQVEAVDASALTHIGQEDFITSHKEASETAAPGSLIEYTLHVVNSGDALAYVTVTDTIPAHTTFYGLDTTPPAVHFTYDGAEDQVMWEGSVAPGEHFMFTFWVEVGYGLHMGDVIDNVAYITFGDTQMPITAETEVVFEDLLFMPFISK